MTPRKRSSDQSSHDTPQKKAKLVHDVCEEHEATASKARPSSKPRCVLTSRHSEKKDGVNVSVGQGDTRAEDVESLSTTTKLPEVYSFARIDRKQGRQDEAAGTSYAVHDSTTKEVAGDTRAEMPYLASDGEIAGLFNDLWSSVDFLSRNYFSDVIPDAEKQKWLKSIPKRLHPKRALDCDFVDLVAQITVRGPCGIGSWEQIFLEPDLRRGLICGIVWKKLNLEVFDKMLFGGTNSQEKELLELEKSMAEHSDGFMRTRARGLRVREMLDYLNPADHYITLDSKHNLPRDLGKACQTVTKQLRGLLSCLIPPTSSPQILTALEEITCKAALLSYRIRLDTETIYYFPFIEKDSRPHFNHAEENITYFSAEHKEWLWSPENRADKTVACPQNGLTEEKVKRICSYDPVIRIICSGAVETYRKGGWRPEDTQKGVRKRTVFPARAIFRWGRPQEKSSLPSGHQEPVSEIHDSPASYIGFRQALGYLGTFRDTVATKTFGEARGLPWYLHDHLQNGVRDPAWSVEGYPILGGRGTGNQPFGLEKFQPSRTSLF
ncbi:Chitin synthase 8 [Venturia nashicola]|nr:Chitin synthase 8 [Venturia nashicola]